MIGLIICLSVFILAFGFIASICGNEYCTWFFELIAIGLAICLGGAIETYQHMDEPKAIDVYRGNTKLEITETVKDSIVIDRDSVVTFEVKQLK